MSKREKDGKHISHEFCISHQDCVQDLLENLEVVCQHLQNINRNHSHTDSLMPEIDPHTQKPYKLYSSRYLLHISNFEQLIQNYVEKHNQIIKSDEAQKIRDAHTKPPPNNETEKWKTMYKETQKVLLQKNSVPRMNKSSTGYHVVNARTPEESKAKIDMNTLTGKDDTKQLKLIDELKLRLKSTEQQLLIERNKNYINDGRQLLMNTNVKTKNNTINNLSSDDLLTLQRQFRELEIKYQCLFLENEQLKIFHEKSNSLQKVLDKKNSDIELLNNKIYSMEREMLEKDSLSDQVADYKEELSNIKLELKTKERMYQDLCENPFFGSQGSIQSLQHEKLNQYQNSTVSLKGKVVYLQSALKAKAEEVLLLKQQNEGLTSENGILRSQLEDLNQDVLETKKNQNTVTNLLSLQNKAFTDQEINEAVAYVIRRKSQQFAPKTCGIDWGNVQMTDIPFIKEKYMKLFDQIKVLKGELEHHQQLVRTMNKTQSLVSQESQLNNTELVKVRKEYHLYKDNMVRKVDHLTHIIQSLQLQLQRDKKTLQIGDYTNDYNNEIIDPNLLEPVVSNQLDLEILNCSYNCHLITNDTFTTLIFMLSHFEPLNSLNAQGKNPDYQFIASYSIENSEILKTLCNDKLLVEVYKSDDNGPTLIGGCNIDVITLLLQNFITDVIIYSSTNNSPIGTISVKSSLIYPLTPNWTRYLSSRFDNPTNILQSIEPNITNDLIFKIYSYSCIDTRQKYESLYFSIEFKNQIYLSHNFNSDNQHSINYSKKFNIAITSSDFEKLLDDSIIVRLLDASKYNTNANLFEGLIGRCSIPLRKIGDVIKYSDKVKLLFENELKGIIDFSVEWAAPLQINQTNNLSLSTSEVRILAENYKSQTTNDLSIDRFIKYMLLRESEVRQQNRMKDLFSRRSLTISILNNLPFNSDNCIDTYEFIQFCTKNQIILDNDEIDLLNKVCDLNDAKMLDRMELQLFLFPTPMIISLETKIRNRFTTLEKEQGIKVIVNKFLSRANQGSRDMTLLQFKAALIDCGFIIDGDNIETTSTDTKNSDFTDSKYPDINVERISPNSDSNKQTIKGYQKDSDNKLHTQSNLSQDLYDIHDIQNFIYCYLYLTKNSLEDISRQCKRYSTDNSGNIQISDLSSCFKQYIQIFDDHIFDSIYEIFKVDKININYIKLFDFYKQKSHENTIAKYLYRFYKMIPEIDTYFKERDVDNFGFFDYSQFKSFFMNSSEIDISQEEIEKIYRQFDLGFGININTFLNYIQSYVEEWLLFYQEKIRRYISTNNIMSFTHFFNDIEEVTTNCIHIDEVIKYLFHKKIYIDEIFINTISKVVMYKGTLTVGSKNNGDTHNSIDKKEFIRALENVTPISFIKDSHLDIKQDNAQIELLIRLKNILYYNTEDYRRIVSQSLAKYDIDCKDLLNLVYFKYSIRDMGIAFTSQEIEIIFEHIQKGSYIRIDDFKHLMDYYNLSETKENLKEYISTYIRNHTNIDVYNEWTKRGDRLSRKNFVIFLKTLFDVEKFAKIYTLVPIIFDLDHTNTYEIEYNSFKEKYMTAQIYSQPEGRNVQAQNDQVGNNSNNIQTNTTPAIQQTQNETKLNESKFSGSQETKNETKT